MPAVAKRTTAQDPAADGPVWLVRVVLALFLIGFAVFFARELRNVIEALG